MNSQLFQSFAENTESREVKESNADIAWKLDDKFIIPTNEVGQNKDPSCTCIAVVELQLQLI